MPFSEWKWRNSSSSDGPIDVGATDRRLEREQQAAHAGEVLIALGEVVVQKIGNDSRRASRPGSRATPLRAVPARRTAGVCGTNGLVMYCVAPAAIAASRLESSPRVVSTTTGTSREPGCRRRNLSTSTPCISGMLRSRIMRATGPSATCSIASSPLAASTKSNDSSARKRGPDHLPDGRRVVDDQDPWHERPKSIRLDVRREAFTSLLTAIARKSFERAIVVPRLALLKPRQLEIGRLRSSLHTAAWCRVREMARQAARC